MMSRQASAEREKRATITKAEGDKEAAVNLSLAAKTMAASPGAMQFGRCKRSTDWARRPPIPSSWRSRSRYSKASRCSRKLTARILPTNERLTRQPEQLTQSKENPCRERYFGT